MISIFLCPVFVNVCCPCCCSKEIGSLGHAGEEICWCSVSFISLHPLGSGAVSVGWNFAQSGSGPGWGVTLRSCCYNITTDDPALNRQSCQGYNVGHQRTFILAAGSSVVVTKPGPQPGGCCSQVSRLSPLLQTLIP